MNKQDTRKRILDSAERLLAKEGYHSATLRAITIDAGVNLAAVNYHFGSKELLVEEVFARKLKPADLIRRPMLKNALKRTLIR